MSRNSSTHIFPETILYYYACLQSGSLRYQSTPMLSNNRIITGTKALISNIWTVYWTLIKIMIPVLIVVKILDHFGFTAALAKIFAPIMALVGLPDTMGLVLATSMLTSLYPAFAVFLTLVGDSPLTVAQVTVLSSMMLLAHSLPIEGAIAKAVGLSWKVILTLRVGGAFVLGFLLHLYYQSTNTMQSMSVILWHPKQTDPSLQTWILSQLEILLGLLLILTILISTLKILQCLGVDKWIHWLLTPFLKLLGISKQASNITVIGIMLGITFGGGLLIQETRNGTISKRDIFLSMSFLCICHSLIDDTIIVLLLGADIMGVLWIRIIFAFVLIALIARLPIFKRWVPKSNSI